MDPVAVAGVVVLAFGLFLAYADLGGFVAKLSYIKTIDAQSKLLETYDRQISAFQAEIAELSGLVKTLTAQVDSLKAEVVELTRALGERELALDRLRQQPRSARSRRVRP